MWMQKAMNNDTHYNTDESQNYYAELQEPGKKSIHTM